MSSIHAARIYSENIMITLSAIGRELMWSSRLSMMREMAMNEAVGVIIVILSAVAYASVVTSTNEVHDD